MSYRHAEDGPGGDATVEARGRSLEELLSSAWRAALEVMVADADRLPAEETVEITLEATDAETLLHDLLEQLLFYKDARGLLLSLASVRVRKEGDEQGAAGSPGYHLRATARGTNIERLYAEGVELGTDVKAVTYHQFRLEQSRAGWFARVVLDT